MLHSSRQRCILRCEMPRISMAPHRVMGFAIAHGMEELCEVAVEPTKKRAKKAEVKEAVLGEEE